MIGKVMRVGSGVFPGLVALLLVLTGAHCVWVRSRFGMIYKDLISGPVPNPLSRYCATQRADAVVFLGIPENESSGQGPVGLINGTPCQINNVSTVLETPYQEYQAAKQSGRVYAEEIHGGIVYYAIKETRDIQFDNASAWVEVIERFKARKP